MHTSHLWIHGSFPVSSSKEPGPKQQTVPGKELFCLFLVTLENPTNHLWVNIPRAFRNTIQTAQHRQSGEGHRVSPQNIPGGTHTYFMHKPKLALKPPFPEWSRRSDCPAGETLAHSDLSLPRQAPCKAMSKPQTNKKNTYFCSSCSKVSSYISTQLHEM